MHCTRAITAVVPVCPITSIYLDEGLLRKVDELKKRLGLASRSDVIRMAIAELARRYGVE